MGKEFGDPKDFPNARGLLNCAAYSRLIAHADCGSRTWRDEPSRGFDIEDPMDWTLGPANVGKSIYRTHD